MATGQRLQALGLMKRDDITYSSRMKSNNPGKNPLVLNFIRYETQELCVYRHLRQYVRQVKLEGVTLAVYATTRKPHVRVPKIP